MMNFEFKMMNCGGACGRTWFRQRGPGYRVVLCLSNKINILNRKSGFLIRKSGFFNRKSEFVPLKTDLDSIAQRSCR